MNKSDLIQELADKAQMSRTEAQGIVDAFVGEIVKALAGGKRVEIRGFGSFRVRQKNSRRGRNPKTGEAITIEEKAFPHFKPGKDLRALCKMLDDNASRLAGSGTSDGN